ncbi:MAG TPA: VOC family protein [Acidimicrobiales bacterium]|nr:VOC family protein [Acidimicrobiales bacterium]
MNRPARLACMARIGRLSVVALDCRDPRALATFYSAITGLEIEDGDDDWVQLRSDGGAALAFQLAPDHEPPVWPSSEHPQQAHLDFDVDDLDAAEVHVLARGARKADVQPGSTFRVFLDPAGHPFCLVLAPEQRDC